jgi:hypothetical protein
LKVREDLFPKIPPGTPPQKASEAGLPEGRPIRFAARDASSEKASFSGALWIESKEYAFFLKKQESH